MARPRGILKPLPNTYLPLIARVIMAWATVESDIDSFIGLEHKEPHSPIKGKVLEISYTKRLGLLREAFASFNAKGLGKLNGIMGAIKPLKDKRDAIAHGGHWFVPYGQTKAKCSSWRWFTDHTLIEFHDFSKADLIQLEANIKKQGQRLRALLHPGSTLMSISNLPPDKLSKDDVLEHLRPLPNWPKPRKRGGKRPSSPKEG